MQIRHSSQGSTLIMKYITQKNFSNINRMPKVFFSCHDSDKHYFDDICDMIFKNIDCAIFYEDNTENISFFELSQMNLTVIPITKCFLYDQCYARCNVLKIIHESHFPVLPILYDSSYESEFDRICGNIHLFNLFDQSLSQEEINNKLKRILEYFLYSKKLVSKIEKIFTTSLFISYRKEDKIIASKMIKKIHEHDKLQDVAIWYDDFLIPGEDFNNSIKKHIINSDAIIITVTPNILSSPNYIMSTEYPIATETNKKIIPIEMKKTNRQAIELCYPGISGCVNIKDIQNIQSQILEIKNRNISAPKHNYDETEKIFLLGMAYLKGINVEINMHKSIKLLTCAASANFIPAIEALIEINEYGIGKKINYKAALKWQKIKIKLIKNKSTLKEQVLETEHLGYLYNQNALYNKALETHKLVIKLKSASSKYSAKSLVSSNNDIGVTYANLGDYNNAIMYFEYAIIALKKIKKAKSIEAASILNNLGLAYGYIGNYSKALDYLQSSLNIRETLLKTNHIDIAVSLNNIGLIYDYLCDYNNSLKYYKLALEILERYYGKNHPKTAITYANIGSIYQSQSNYDNALKCYEISLEIKKSIYGENHPDTASTYNNMASLYYDLMDYEKSLELSELTLKILEYILGTSHPLTANMYNNIGLLQSKLGRNKSALNYHLKALEVREKINENNKNIHVAETYLNLGTVYGNLNDYNKAFDYSYKALDIYIEAFERNHITVSNCYNNLGYLYYYTNELKKSIQYYSLSLEIKRNILGENNLLVANTQYNIALAYKELGDYNQALEFYREALKTKEIILGKDNESVKAIRKEIDELTGVIQIPDISIT